MGDGEVGFSKLNGGLQAFFVILGIVGMIVPVVLGFVNLDSRQDVLEEKTDTHILKDEVKWANVDEDIDSLKEKDHILEISLKEQAIQFTYIRKELEALNIKMDNFEVR